MAACDSNSPDVFQILRLLFSDFPCICHRTEHVSHNYFLMVFLFPIWLCWEHTVLSAFSQTCRVSHFICLLPFSEEKMVHLGWEALTTSFRVKGSLDWSRGERDCELLWFFGISPLTHLFSFFFFFIGYGTLHPKTAGGQIFCVFFALFGIPLNIVFLHRVGKMLSLLCKKLGKFLYEKGMRKVIGFSYSGIVICSFLVFFSSFMLLYPQIYLLLCWVRCSRAGKEAFFTCRAKQTCQP